MQRVLPDTTDTKWLQFNAQKNEKQQDKQQKVKNMESYQLTKLTTRKRKKQTQKDQLSVKFTESYSIGYR